MARPVVMYNPDIDTDIDMESGLEDERWTAAFREHLRAREEPSAPPMEPPEEEPEQGETKEDDPERTVATEDGEGARAEAMEACPQVASCNLSRVYFQAEDPVRTSDIEDLLESDEEDARISTSDLLASNSEDEWTRPQEDESEDEGNLISMEETRVLREQLEAELQFGDIAQLDGDDDLALEAVAASEAAQPAQPKDKKVKKVVIITGEAKPAEGPAAVNVVKASRGYKEVAASGETFDLYSLQNVTVGPKNRLVAEKGRVPRITYRPGSVVRPKKPHGHAILSKRMSHGSGKVRYSGMLAVKAEAVLHF
jgi:hypothetical protein